MLKMSLQLRLGQQLTMTPQLQQAIRLLQLPITELQAQIREALEKNVMLEALDEGLETDSTAERRGEEATPQVETNWDDTPAVGAADFGWQSSGGERRGTTDFIPAAGKTLQEHLLWQLELEHVDNRGYTIGAAIIDAINDDGYVLESLDEVRKTLEPEVTAASDEIEAVLSRIQNLDPAGVGCRSVSECIALQLRQLDDDTPGRDLALMIADDYLELIAENKIGSLRRRLRTSEDELEQAIALLRSMHPRPGSAINPGTSDYVVPDVFVRMIDGRWLVEINPGTAPSLRINQNYAGLLSRGTDHSILRAQLQEARWLIRSLEIRHETLLKVATAIVERQHAFLQHGDESMQPLVLRDVAEALDMHESTISRVTTNKYMHTPRGVFEFRYFFSSHVGTTDGGECSSVAIRAMIRKLIAQEQPKKPLSDSKISKLLEEDGIRVARRTVAKYREAMSIPSSSERRKLAARQNK